MIPNKKYIETTRRATAPEKNSPAAPLAAMLHARGLRVTSQKLAVYRLLQQTNYHPTPEMIHAEVRRSHPMTGLGTIYQILEQFHRIGVARRIFSNGNRQRYDGKLDPHAHFVCERCGRLDDVEDRFIDRFKARLGRKYDFHIRRLYFEFSGLCARCAGSGRRLNRRLEHSGNCARLKESRPHSLGRVKRRSES
ncbi:MAG: transcriptional repressor [Acidobacteriia bacterium]|nr:transcriptional repressor [Terriglobia bacterium]